LITNSATQLFSARIHWCDKAFFETDGMPFYLKSNTTATCMWL
jgi:hypothetical protein